MADSEPGRENEGGKRILIVDSHLGLAELLGENLKCDGYECDFVKDAEEAVKLLDSSRGRYALAIVDSSIPADFYGPGAVSGGLRLVEDISTRLDRFPVLLMGESEMDQENNSFFEQIKQDTGLAHSFLSRPFSVEEIYSSLEKLPVFQSEESSEDHGMTVLLMHKDDTYKSLLGNYLESLGFGVEDAESADALKKVMSDPYHNIDVIISDKDNSQTLDEIVAGAVNHIKFDKNCKTSLLAKMCDELKQTSYCEAISRIKINAAKNKILVLDTPDNYLSDNLKKYTNFMEGVEIDVVNSGAEAMQRIQKEKYSLAVLNLILAKPEKYNDADMDGCGFADLIQNSKKDLPVITASRFSFLKSSNPQVKAHVQLKFEDDIQTLGNNIIEVLSGLNDFYSSYEFESYENMEISLHTQELINTFSLKDIERNLIFYGLEEGIKKEIYFFGIGSAGREQGFITRKTALETIIRRNMACREIQAGKAIDINPMKFEENMWKIYNEKQGRISFSEALEMAGSDLVEGETVPRVIVLIGPTASGKTTTALKLEKWKHGVYIGNIKTGEKREWERKDEYLTNKREIEYLENHLEEEGRSIYYHLGRKYFSKDREILRALNKGKDVILVRNIRGLKAVENLLFNNDVNAKIIAIKLGAPKPTLESRIDERDTSVKEYYRRMKDLGKSIDEYNKNQGYWDASVSTDIPEGYTKNKSIIRATEEAAKAAEKLLREKTILRYEFSNYIRDKIRRITDSHKTKPEDMIRRINSRPWIVGLKGNSILENVEIVKADIYKGRFTFYLNPLYAAEKGQQDEKQISQEVTDRKKQLVKYLADIFGEEPHEMKLSYGADPSSTYSGGTKAVYGNNKRIDLDDLVLFSLHRGNRPSTPMGDEIHSVAFVCLTKEAGKEIYIEHLERSKHG